MRFVILIIFGVAPAIASETGQTGGLVSYALPEIGENLLTNSGFEEASGNRPGHWTDNGAFAVDHNVAHSGQSSFRLTDPYLTPYIKSATQDVLLKKGSYRIGAWVKTLELGANKPTGVRICLAAPTSWPAIYGSGCTATIKGTSEWQYLALKNIAITQDTMARFSLTAYGSPDGSAWFDDVELRREQQPLQVFMLYPNYRGLLFDDRSQVSRFSISIDLPEGHAAPDLVLKGEIVDENAGTVFIQKDFGVAATETVSFDCSTLQSGRPYLVRFSLIRGNGTEPEHTHPAYRIIKMPGSTRQSMKISFDEENRFLIRGKPRFLLGVYDSGLGYTTSERGWEDMFASQRRLLELPINFYLNYWYGAAPNPSMEAMMNVLEARGIYTLTNANCFGTSTAEQMGDSWFLSSTDAVVQQRTRQQGFGGFYGADECQASLAPDVFANYQRMKTLDPDGIVLGTLLPDPQLPFWRDSVDVLATDPYPLYGLEPAGGYPLSKVADGARMTAEAVQHSRPFVTTLQFFQGTSNSRWPTQAELRSMSYAAIVEGANGLFYWSLGARALAYVCTGWCETKSDYFERLKTVMNELKRMEPILAAADRPEFLIANSNPAALRTRVKYDGSLTYLIAYNVSATAETATFTYQVPLATIGRGRGRQVLNEAVTFTETFHGYEPRVYKLLKQPAVVDTY